MTVWQRSKYKKGFLKWIIKHYHTRRGIASIISFSLQNIAKAFYGNRRLEIGKILRELCKWKGVGILEAEVCVEHIHMLLEIPPKFSVSSVVGYLKGKSSLKMG